MTATLLLEQGVDLVVATHLGMGSLTDHAPRVLLVAATLVGVWLLLVVVR
ncbi:hypothetical protein AB4212_56200 [Streptomyces sp. 2MCAF27]